MESKQSVYRFIKITHEYDKEKKYYNKINDNLYTYLKTLPYKRTSYPKDKAIAYDDVYFVFEKLTSENKHFWKKFCENQQTNTRRLGVQTDHGIISTNDGTSSFLISLNMLGCSVRNNFSIWIAYVVRNVENFERDNIVGNNIEMVFSVFASDESPITTHMGIFRNYKYYKSNRHHHIGLSLKLHEFAGYMSKIIYPNVEYMVTNPAGKMQELMRKTFTYGQIWIGSNTEREKSKNEIKNIEDDELLLNSFADKKDELTIDDLKKFKSIGDSYTLDNINETYEEMKDRDKNFLFNEVKSEIDDEKEYIEDKKEDKSKQFFPESGTIPLNNEGDTWSIITHNGEEKTFKIPRWFDDKKINFSVCKHDHVLNHLLTVIISIPVLVNLWKKQ